MMFKESHRFKHLFSIEHIRNFYVQRKKISMLRRTSILKNSSLQLKRPICDSETTYCRSLT